MARQKPLILYLLIAIVAGYLLIPSVHTSINGIFSTSNTPSGASPVEATPVTTPACPQVYTDDNSLAYLILGIIIGVGSCVLFYWQLIIKKRERPEPFIKDKPAVWSDESLNKIKKLRKKVKKDGKGKRGSVRSGQREDSYY